MEWTVFANCLGETTSYVPMMSAGPREIRRFHKLPQQGYIVCLKVKGTGFFGFYILIKNYAGSRTRILGLINGLE